MATDLAMGTAQGDPNDRPARRLVACRLGGRAFGVPLERVREVVALGTVTPIPFAPPKVRGAINLGGRFATVIDLRIALGLPARTKQGAEIGLAVEHGGHLYTLMVDAVDEVAEDAAGGAPAEAIDIAAVVAP